MLALHGQPQGQPQGQPLRLTLKVNPTSGGQECPPYIFGQELAERAPRPHALLLPDSGDDLCGAVTLFVKLLDAEIIFNGAQDAVMVDCG